MTRECNLGQFNFFDVKNKYGACLRERERASAEGDSTCYARNHIPKSARWRQMKKGFPLLVLENKVPMRKKKAEGRIKDDIQKAREMHKKHNEPDGEHNTNFYFEIVTQHQF